MPKGKNIVQSSDHSNVVPWTNARDLLYGMAISDPETLRQRANKFRELSSDGCDEQLNSALRELADEFDREADEAEAMSKIERDMKRAAQQLRKSQPKPVRIEQPFRRQLRLRSSGDQSTGSRELRQAQSGPR
jgi:hypothetical protein